MTFVTDKSNYVFNLVPILILNVWSLGFALLFLFSLLSIHLLELSKIFWLLGSLHDPYGY